VLQGSGGWCPACRVEAGDAGQGDFEAEGAELADVVGDLPAGGGLPCRVPSLKMSGPRDG
jgi:hypothetical protein